MTIQANLLFHFRGQA